MFQNVAEPYPERKAKAPCAQLVLLKWQSGGLLQTSRVFLPPLKSVVASSKGGSVYRVASGAETALFTLVALVL